MIFWAGFLDSLATFYLLALCQIKRFQIDYCVFNFFFILNHLSCFYSFFFSFLLLFSSDSKMVICEPPKLTSDSNLLSGFAWITFTWGELPSLGKFAQRNDFCPEKLTHLGCIHPQGTATISRQITFSLHL